VFLAITPHQSNTKFVSTQSAKFRQLTKMDTAFDRLESARSLSLRYLVRNCLRSKAWTACKLQRSSKCYHRQTAWRRH